MSHLDRLFDMPIFGQLIKKVIVKAEGGEMESSTLRNYCARKYKVSVDKYSYGSIFSGYFNTGGEISVGRYCSFASDIHYYGANHPYRYASTSPFFYNRVFGYDVKDVERHKLTIGNDVWIGNGVKITSSCHVIGNGAVIGTGAIVTSDVPPYAIVVGTPAKVISKRFDDQTIEKLEKSKWWQLPPKELMKYYKYIEEPSVWADKIMEDVK